MKRDLLLGFSFAVLVASVLLCVLGRNLVKSNKKRTRRRADDTGASSSSAASAVSNSYDVFLSFSGEDTRRTFTDHLYKGLVEAGICVFRDNMLPEGEKIGINLFQAIKNSKISIAILSPNYASSEWCLEELVEMTECIKSGHIVLPIFYHVEPTHVGKQKGSFGKTFSRLSSNYVKEDVAKWKQALREVASIKGWELKKTADGHEGDLVEMVVRKVSSELKKASQPVVTEQLVGINNAVEDIFRLLDDNNPSATQIVGIYGMGGIGKTTLAKSIHKKLSDQFKYHSLILDIRESSRRNGIFYLQNQLIRHLKEKDQASNKDDGISLLGSRFKRKKVLILLDDVDDIEQIRALVGEYDWFEMGSRIIITTRSMSVLDEADVKCRYERKEMAEDESMVLFSRHAFRRDSPLCEFESLSRAVVSTTGGLPLALKVIGSLLYRKNQAFWQDLLKKLQKVPHEKVQEKLRISYEALNYEEKQIFLDIACFYSGIDEDDIGIDVDEVSYMWDACNFFPKMGIETLSLMSLIKIEGNHVLNMHDQLRKLGREIVRQEDYNMPMNRSRLWFPEEALEVLQTNKGIEKDRVQALLLDGIELPIEITTEQLETLPNLRLLIVSNAKLIGDSKSLLPKLRSLFWKGCPAFVPTRFHLEKLVILNLQASDISETWEGWSHLQVAKQLKVLILRYCYNLKITPDLSPFRNLEMLNLRGCENLEKIHPSIGEARGLVFLFLMGCKKLSKLPHEMGKLEELKQLHIWETAIQEIPACVGSLKKLQWLDASDCSSLVALPDSISHLINLSGLRLDGCSGLCTLPKSIGSLVKLWHLSLSRTGVSIDLRFDYRIPNSIGKLEGLTVLNLSYSGICELSKSIGDLKNLEILDISHCEKLSSLPSTIGKLGNLEELDASNCKNLEGEIHIDGLSSLKILHLSSTGVSGFHGTFNKVSCLEQLMLDDCHMLQSLPELPTSLTVLKVSGRHSTFPQLSRLNYLRKLTVKDCPLLKSMPELPLRLSELSVDNCGELKELPNLSNLEFLSELCLESCGELTEIRGLEGLKSLKWLLVSSCWKLSNLDGLEHLESLRDLYLWSSGSILKDDQIRGFEKLKNLEELQLLGCESLVRVDVSQLTHLKALDFCGCCNLLEIKGLERLKDLTKLELVGCPASETLPDLSCLPNLELVC